MDRLFLKMPVRLGPMARQTAADANRRQDRVYYNAFHLRI